jgi:uncharacterized protein (TIGR02996 family)
MRTFEFIDDGSRKFWNIELDGNKTIVTFGRIGTKGQTKTKEHASAAAAQKEYDKLIKEKLGKGYTETTPAAGEEPTPGVEAPPSVGGRAAGLKEALEAALVENPDDVATHAAYADLLSEQGDPRGELIQVQLALEDPKLSAKKRRDLAAREKELFDEHDRTWYGSLAPYILDNEGLTEWERTNLERRRVLGEAPGEPDGSGYCYWCRWRRGWIDTVNLHRVVGDALPALTQAPNLLLLRELRIPYQDWDADAPDLSPLLAAPLLRNLRVFQLGPDNDECHISGPDVHHLVAQMPRLEELKLFAHRIDTAALFKIRMPNLRVLYAHHLYQYPLEVLAENESLSKLETLSLWPHMIEPGDTAPYITEASSIALVHSPHLMNLRHLELFCSALGDAGCDAIVASGILKRLKVLDISRGRVTDAGARALASCPDFRNLERFGIAQNALTPAGIAALEATGVPITAGDQYDPAEMDELAFQWEGDME